MGRSTTAWRTTSRPRRLGLNIAADPEIGLIFLSLPEVGFGVWGLGFRVWDLGFRV